MGLQFSQDGPTLAAKLQKMLDAEGFEDFDQFEHALRRTRVEVKEIESKGRLGSARAKKIVALLNEYTKISKLSEELAALTTAKLQSLEEELEAALKKHGFDTELEAVEEQRSLEQELEQLKQKDKLSGARGKRVTDQLDALQEVIEIRAQVLRFREGGFGGGEGDPSPEDASLRSSSPIESLGPDCEWDRCLDQMRDAVEMPNCAVKSLVQLCAHFDSLRRLSQKDPSVSLELDTIFTTIETLEGQLAAEQLDDPVVTDCMQEIRDLLSAHAPIDHDTMMALRSTFWRLLKHIQPLDIDFMLSLISTAQETIQAVRGRDVIFLLGGTGSGKSTTIHYLGESTMQRRTEFGTDHIHPVACSPALERFTVSASAHSQTQTIQAVKVCAPTAGNDKQDCTVTLCDTPGFEDTEGAEVDIANAYSIAKATRMCQSVRPFVLISWLGMGDRGEGLTKVLGILVRMFKNPSNNLDSFTYAFTKVPPYREGHIHGILENKLKHVSESESNNQEFVALLQDMVRKTKERALIINPLDDASRREVLQIVLKAQTINEPHTALRSYVADSALYLLETQLGKMVESIYRALDQGNDALMCYKFRQLGNLSEQIPVFSIQNAHQRCSQRVLSHIDRVVEGLFTRLDTTFCGKDTSSDDLKLCKESVERLVQISTIDSYVHGDVHDSVDRCMTKILHTQEALSKSVQILLSRLEKDAEAVMRSDSFERSLGDPLGPSFDRAVSDNLGSSMERAVSDPERSPPRTGSGRAFDRSVSDLSSSGSFVAPRTPQNPLSAPKPPKDLNDAVRARICQAGQHVTNMRLICDVLGKLVAPNMAETMSALYHQRVNDFMDLYRKFKYTAFELMQQTALTKFVEVLDVMRQIIECSRSHSLAKPLTSCFDADVGNFKRLLVQAVDEVVDLLSASLHARGNGADDGTLGTTLTKEQLDRVMQVSREFSSVAQHAAFNQQLGRAAISTQRQKLQVAFQSFFNETSAVIRSLLYNDASGEFLLREAMAVLSATHTFSGLHFFGKPGIASVQDIVTEITRMLGRCSERALAHLHKLRYVNKLSEKDYRDLFLTIERLADFDCFVSVQDQGYAKYLLYRDALERVRQEVCTVLSSKVEAIRNLPFAFGNHWAVQEAIPIQAMANRFLQIASSVPQVTDIAHGIDKLLAERVSRALEAFKAEFLQLLEQWPHDVLFTLESMVDAFLFLGACESITSTTDCSAWLEENFKEYCTSRDKKVDRCFQRMSSLLSDLFPGNGPPPSSPIDLDDVNTDGVTGMIEWMKCQAAFSKFYPKHSTTQDTKSMQLYTSFGKAAQESSAKFTNMLETAYNTLDESVKKATPVQLHGALLCARIWSRFDVVMAKEHQFKALLNDLEQEIVKVDTSVLGGLRVDLQMGRYQEFAEKYASLDKTHPDFPEVSNELCNRVRTLISTAEASIASLEIGSCTVDHFQDAVQQLRELCDVHTHVKALVPAAVQVALKPHALVQKLQEGLAAAVDAVDLSACADFRAAESELRSLEDKSACLVGLGDAMDADKATAVAERVQGHQEGLKAALNVACDRYEGPAGPAGTPVAASRWVQYFQAWGERPPRELYEAIAPGSEGPNPLFAAALERLLETLNAQFDAACAAVEDEAELDAAFALAQALEEALRYLPSPLIQSADARTRDVRFSVQQRQTALVRVIRDEAAAGRLQPLVEQLAELRDARQYPLMELARTETRRLVLAQVASVTSEVQRGAAAPALQSLPEAWAQWQAYLRALPPPADAPMPPAWQWLGADAECARACTEVERSLAAALGHRLAGLEEARAAGFAELVACAEADFDLLVALPAVAEHPQGPPLLQALGLDLAARAGAVIEAVLEAFEGLQETFTAQMSSELDAGALGPLLERGQQAQGLRAQLEAYATAPECRRAHPRLLVRLDQCSTFQKMAEVVWALAGTLLAAVQQPLVPKWDAADRLASNRTLSEAYQRLQPVEELGSLLQAAGLDTASLARQVEAHFQAELRHMADALRQQATQVPGVDALYAELHAGIESLQAFADHFPATIPAKEAAACAQGVVQQVVARARDIRAAAWAARTRDGAMMDPLVELKRIAMAVAACRQPVDRIIDVLLQDLKTYFGAGGTKEIALLAVKLNAVEEPEKQAVAQMLIADHDAFQGYALALRNEKTLKFRINEVLDGLRGTAVDTAELSRLYIDFDAEYWSLVERGLGNAAVKEGLPAAAHGIAHAAPGGAPDAATVRRLLAHLFAFWTLDNSKQYAEAFAARQNATTSLMNYLLQPYSTQVPDPHLLSASRSMGLSVVAIFRLFGLDTPKDGLYVHHLVQMGAGEGKSVTLAMTAATLALLGHHVDCVSYSSYLSQRDHAAFDGLFRAFGLEDRLRYGVFHTLCEGLLHAKGDVRGMVIDMIKRDAAAAESGAAAETEGNAAGDAAARPGPVAVTGPAERVLLIDEADVFFRGDFYGNAHKPQAMLQDPAVHSLVRCVWDRRARQPGLAALMDTAEYRTLCARFPDWGPLLEECLKGMIADVKAFASPEYVVKNGRIGYELENGLSFTATYGYKTMFAHFQEHEAHRISEAARDARVGLIIKCGSFSYAELPQAYKCILGLTGTLETMSQPEKRVLEDTYAIKKNTYMPSVYGQSQLQFAPESQQCVMIEPSHSYFSALRSEINRRLVGASHAQRAVLVFFASQAQLQDFHNAPEMVDLCDTVRTMTKETSAQEKDTVVRQAVIPGSVTLLTREYGYGTDFMCFDDRLISAGGVHVIQTFLSDCLSEEIHIKGRTARQGDIGSYSMVLKEDELQRFSITPTAVEDMRENGQYYSALHEHRQAFFEELYPKTVHLAGEMCTDHMQSMKFVDHLLQNNNPAVLQFLVAHQQSPVKDANDSA